MRAVVNIFCAIFCVSVVFKVEAKPDEFDSYKLAEKLAPLTKNENVFLSPTNLTNATANTHNSKNINNAVETKQMSKETNTSGISVPKVFPNGESKGVNIKNYDEHLLHISSTSQKGATDTEVKDMLRVNTNLTANSNSFSLPRAAVVPDKVDKQAELIENGENTEDKRVLDHHYASKLEEINKISTDPISHGNVAAIFLGTIMLLAVVCYVGMLSWRRYIERKYGSRQILVNEEDFSIEDPNDMRHFTI